MITLHLPMCYSSCFWRIEHFNHIQYSSYQLNNPINQTEMQCSTVLQFEEDRYLTKPFSIHQEVFRKEKKKLNTGTSSTVQDASHFSALRCGDEASVIFRFTQTCHKNPSMIWRSVFCRAMTNQGWRTTEPGSKRGKAKINN